ncbi:MAG: class C sortase [Microbacteriaceae bacterium]|nr:class C sortase [Microbacteriaceae bacterium]MCI1207331.1 class C sortase [Microbacteriaceae bacterium]
MSRQGGERRHRWRLRWWSIPIALTALLGVGLLLYPTAASWVSQVNQSGAISAYSDHVQSADPGAKAQLQLAHEYNAALNSGAVLEAGNRRPTGDGTNSGGLQYDQMLRADDSGLMARLKIPAIAVDLPVYHGTSDSTLLRGVGHLEGTSLPVGGTGTHSVLTGHRGLASARMFTDLNRLKRGDTFTITVFGKVLEYRIVKKQVVDPDQTASLRPVHGKDLVTLVTCTPLGINSQRILVTGERVQPVSASTAAEAKHDPTIPGFPWWSLVLAGAVALIAAFVWWSGRPGRTTTQKTRTRSREMPSGR